jgi:hypothetical protein
MATSSTIEIIISARDQFSPAFRELDEAFGRAGKSGGGMRESVEELDGALGDLTQETTEAGAATSAFAEHASASLMALAALRAELERDGAVLSEEAATAHGDEMVAIEEETQQGLTDVVGEGMGQRLDMEELLRQAEEEARRRSRERQLVEERSYLDARLSVYQAFYERLAELAETQGRAMAGVSKSLAIAAALIDAYRAANAALASVPFPLNFVAAAAVLAEGLANVQRIRQVNAAHGGLEEVTEDGTFVLRRGERVLAPRQNEDLTAFLQRQEEPERAGTVIENLEIHILENATASSALLTMGTADWRRVVAEKVIPALNELAALGIRPAFAGSAA